MKKYLLTAVLLVFKSQIGLSSPKLQEVFLSPQLTDASPSFWTIKKKRIETKFYSYCLSIYNKIVEKREFVKHNVSFLASYHFPNNMRSFFHKKIGMQEEKIFIPKCNPKLVNDYTTKAISEIYVSKFSTKTSGSSLILSLGSSYINFISLFSTVIQV